MLTLQIIHSIVYLFQLFTNSGRKWLYTFILFFYFKADLKSPSSGHFKAHLIATVTGLFGYLAGLFLFQCRMCRGDVEQRILLKKNVRSNCWAKPVTSLGNWFCKLDFLHVRSRGQMI